MKWQQHYLRIGTGRNHSFCKTTTIQIPNRSLVTIEGTQPFAILRSPNRGSVIFRPGEEQVTVKVEFDDSDGTFVSF